MFDKSLSVKSFKYFHLSFQIKIFENNLIFILMHPYILSFYILFRQKIVDEKIKRFFLQYFYFLFIKHIANILSYFFRINLEGKNWITRNIIRFLSYLNGLLDLNLVSSVSTKIFINTFLELFPVHRNVSSFRTLDNHRVLRPLQSKYHYL